MIQYALLFTGISRHVKHARKVMPGDVNSVDDLGKIKYILGHGQFYPHLNQAVACKADSNALARITSQKNHSTEVGGEYFYRLLPVTLNNGGSTPV